MPGLIRSFKGLIRPRGVSLNTNSISVEETKTYQLIATITPSGIKNNKIKWNSSDNSIATVDNNGLVTAVSTGNCTITVTTDDRGFTSTCSCEVWVTPITSFQLNKTSTSITYGNTEQLTVTISPNDATYKGVIWSSSNNTIATVDSNGVITPVWEGNCTITCTSEDGVHSASCTVAIDLIHVTGITLNKNSAEVLAGKPEQLTATITPSNANIKTVNWTSSDTSVATVSNTGLVTYVADGNCIITATTVDGGYIATCSVECVSFTPVDICFGYTGAQQSILLQPHEYKIEVWGAQGGFYTTNTCGKGGYAAGCINITTPTCLYVYVGGQGCSGYNGAVATGGWNGGGCGYSYSSRYDGGGGGGTDVRIGGNTIYHRRIVAGGGGGGGLFSSYIGYGGAGGGINGVTGGTAYSSYYGGGGGTQTAGGAGGGNGQYMVAGSFGQGGYKTSGASGYNGSGGGGGWYGGGPGAAVSAAGGGGSGYVYTSSTRSSAPSGYCHCTDYYFTGACCCCGLCSFPTAAGGTETGHTGCGCVRIRSL